MEQGSTNAANQQRAIGWVMYVMFSASLLAIATVTARPAIGQVPADTSHTSTATCNIRQPNAAYAMTQHAVVWEQRDDRCDNAVDFGTCELRDIITTKNASPACCSMTALCPACGTRGWRSLPDRRFGSTSLTTAPSPSSAICSTAQSGSETAAEQQQHQQERKQVKLPERGFFAEANTKGADHATIARRRARNLSAQRSACRPIPPFPTG